MNLLSALPPVRQPVILGVGVVVAVLAAWVARKRYPGFSALIAQLNDESGSAFPPAAEAGSSAWFLGGMLFVIGALVLLEVQQPFYFTQDDTLVNTLPITLEGCRSIWAGIWPEYDPCRLMGGPLASLGMYQVTYPPILLSFAIAHHLLGNDNLMMEVCAILHIVAGYACTYALLRRLGMRAMIACCGSLSFVLSGGILLLGRCWPQFICIAVWMPVLMIWVDRLRGEKRIGWGWIVGIAVLGAMLFYTGFPVIWMFGMLFLASGVIVMAATGTVPLQRLKPILPAGMLMLALIMPLMITQYLIGQSAQRPPPDGSGIGDSLMQMLLPYPLTHTDAVIFEWSHFPESVANGEIHYFGTVFALLFFVTVVLMLTTRSLRSWGRNPWLAPAVLALVIALGTDGGIFYFLSRISLVSLISNHPVRALPYLVLMVVASAGLFAERLLRVLPSANRFARPLAVITMILLAYHVHVSRGGFYVYGFRPYPPIAPQVDTLLTQSPQQRIMSWYPARSTSPQFATVLPMDLANAHNLFALIGYDSLLEYLDGFYAVNVNVNDQPLNAMRAYGVRWHLYSPLVDPILQENRPPTDPKATPIPFREALPALRPHWVQRADAPGVVLYELDDVSPLAFADSEPKRPLPFQARGDGITIDVSSFHSGGSVTANWIRWPQMLASVDGAQVSCGRDQWTRIHIDVPAGAHVLRIHYDGGWSTGLLASAALVVLAGLAELWIMQPSTKNAHAPVQSV